MFIKKYTRPLPDIFIELANISALCQFAPQKSIAFQFLFYQTKSNIANLLSSKYLRVITWSIF